MNMSSINIVNMQCLTFGMFRVSFVKGGLHYVVMRCMLTHALVVNMDLTL